METFSIAQLLRDYGASGVSALCVSAMVAMFWKLLASQAQIVVELNAAQEKETAALRAVLPVVEKLLIAVSVLESKNRRRREDATNPGVPNPLLRDTNK